MLSLIKSGSGCRQKVAILVFVSEVMHVNFNYKLRYVCPYRGKKQKKKTMLKINSYSPDFVTHTRVSLRV